MKGGGHRMGPGEKSNCHASLTKPQQPQLGALEHSPSESPKMCGNDWAFMLLLCSVTRCRQPLEGCELGLNGSLQTRQTLKQLTAGGCLWTSFPPVGQRVLHWGRPWWCLFVPPTVHLLHLFFWVPSGLSLREET